MSIGLCPIHADAKTRDRKKAAAKERVVENRDREVAQERAVEEAAAAPKEEAPAEKANEGKERAAGGEDLYKFEQPAVEEESYAWIIFKTIFIIGLLAGGFYYFFRFVAKKSGMQLPGGGLIQVLATVPMGQNKFLQVVDLAGKVLVLGVSDNAVSLLMEIKDKEEIDRIRLAGSKAAPLQPGGFQEFLTKQVSRLMKLRREGGAIHAAAVSPAPATEPAAHGEPEAERLDFLARQRERLKRMNGTDEAE